VEKLNANRSMGTPPGEDTVGWPEIVANRLTTDAPFYRRLHLINENFGGEGKRDNLVPGSQLNNSTHLRGVEVPIKQLVGDAPGDASKRAVVWYEAQVSYFASSTANSWPAAVRALRRPSDYAEHIDFRWGLHRPRGSQWVRDNSPVGTFRLGPIPLPELTVTA
jgi:hypothetical protein